MHAQSITSALSVRWKPVVGFPGYRISDDGMPESCWSGGCRPRMTDQWHPLVPQPCSKFGHLLVGLSRDRKSHKRLVHRLVLEAFVGPCPEGMEVCHDPDPDPSNNRLGNLRWDTRSANQADSIRHGTKHCPRGEANPRSKLTEPVVVRIMELRNTEKLGAKAICKRLGLPMPMRGAVGEIIFGRNWTHVTGMTEKGRTNDR